MNELDAFHEDLGCATVQVGGTYTPIVGNFAGGRADDIFWYAPGSTPDYLWISSTTRGSFTKVRKDVSGTYRPLVGDFVGGAMFAFQALSAYNNSFRGASALAIVKGFEGIGAKPGDVVIFSRLMDSKSLFLTANADTIYVMGSLDLSKGPVVIETLAFLGSARSARQWSSRLRRT